MSGLPGDLREANSGLAELQHGAVVGVGEVGDAEDVRGQAQPVGDVAARGGVLEAAFAELIAETVVLS